MPLKLKSTPSRMKPNHWALSAFCKEPFPRRLPSSSSSVSTNTSTAIWSQLHLSSVHWQAHLWWWCLERWSPCSSTTRWSTILRTSNVKLLTVSVWSRGSHAYGSYTFSWPLVDSYDDPIATRSISSVLKWSTPSSTLFGPIFRLIHQTQAITWWPAVWQAIYMSSLDSLHPIWPDVGP